MQTDEGTEFFNKELSRLFRDNNVTLYTTKMNHGHAFLAEQKIRELKNKLTKMKSRQPNMSISAALQTVQRNMNDSLIGYIGLSPKQIEREYADVTDESIRKLFVGDKITKQRDRQRRYHVQKDKVKKRRLPTLKVGDLVYIAYGRKLKKYYRWVPIPFCVTFAMFNATNAIRQ